MDNYFADNALCSCQKDRTCASCRFCLTHHTPGGRKALCEKMTHFLLFKSFYQSAVAFTIEKIFPGRIMYDDEKDICRLLFEAVLFEDTHTGMTPFSYFVNHAPLSVDEKRLYEAWRAHTRYEFFLVEKVMPGKELHLSNLSGTNRYRVYENQGTTSIKERMVRPYLPLSERMDDYHGSCGFFLRQ